MGWFLPCIIFKSPTLGYSDSILALLISDLFLCIDRIGVHWSLYLSLGVISNCWLTVYKLDIQIYVSCRLEEGCGKGSGCLQLIFENNQLFCFIKISFKFFAQYFLCWSLTCVFLFTVSALINHEMFPQVWFQIFCGLYSNCTYIFWFPAGWWNDIVIVPVVLLYLDLSWSS